MGLVDHKLAQEACDGLISLNNFNLVGKVEENKISVYCSHKNDERQKAIIMYNVKNGSLDGYCSLLFDDNYTNDAKKKEVVVWIANPTIKLGIYYKEGVLHGRRMYVNNKDKITMVTHYDNGMMHGKGVFTCEEYEFSTYFTDGKLNGKSLITYKQNYNIKIKGQYLHGLNHGVWYVIHDGKPRVKITFPNDNCYDIDTPVPVMEAGKTKQTPISDLIKNKMCSYWISKFPYDHLVFH